MMTDNPPLVIANNTTFLHSRDILTREAVTRCTLQENKVELLKVASGISLRLYNKGMCPTIYHVDINVNLYGYVHQLILSTLTLDNPSHKVCHATFTHLTAHKLIVLLADLSIQPCDGNRDDALSYYSTDDFLPVKSEQKNG